MEDEAVFHAKINSLLAKVTYRLSKEVFSLERDADSTDPKQPFVLFRSLPVPKE